MNRAFRSLGSALVTGFLVIIPAWLSLLLLIKLLTQLSALLRPISKLLPPGLIHPDLVGAVGFVLICLVAGLLVRTAIGRAFGHRYEHLFLRFPGYQSCEASLANSSTPLPTLDLNPSSLKWKTAVWLPPSWSKLTLTTGNCLYAIRSHAAGRNDLPHA